MIRHRIRIWHVTVLIALIAAAFAAQLIISIGVAHSTYRLSALQQQSRQLTRTAQPIKEQIAAKQSPQNLSAAAEKLGMVSSGSPQFIDVTAGTVLGSSGTPGGSVGSDGQSVANAVLQTAGQTASGQEDSAASTDSSTQQQASGKSSTEASSKEKTVATGSSSSSGSGTTDNELPAATLR
ncbi:MAG: hypothetical protein LKF88_06060 [Microbacteriaceae bacterium]|jgi:hypothetical protein|nr:hypothetical protein [Microbacteriaceae bacterium]MCI1207392.1 hypothetical protein [Microbacteriaceae bacterium]